MKLDLAGLDASGRAAAVDILGTRRSLSDEAARFLEGIALSDKEAAPTRAKAVSGLRRRHRQAAMRVMAGIGRRDAPPVELLDAWRDYLRDEDHARHVADFRKLSEDEDPARRELAYAVLVVLANNPKARGNSRSEAGRLIEAAWRNPRLAASLLKAIGRTDSLAYAFQVRSRLVDKDPEVRVAAAFAARRLELDSESGRDRGPTIASLPYETAVAAALKEKGDPRAGERLFQRQGCMACHTVAPGEVAKGPSLLGISARYSRAELIESILKPSAKIAQGFEPQKIAKVDGRTYEGFVVRESGSEVELRDAQGGAIVLPKNDIDERARGQVTVMPVGLVDPLTVQDLASLLAYLESLKSG